MNTAGAVVDAALFEAYGVSFEVRTPNSLMLQQVADALPWAVPVRASPYPALRRYSIADAAGPGYTLTADEQSIACAHELDEIVERLESDARLAVAERNPQRVFVHAGVVGWRGKAIVLPGRSFAGKSSLVAELVKQGASYYSDEYAVCGDDGCVYPFAKPIDLRAHGETRQKRIEVGALGGRYGFEPLRVGLVLFTRFYKGAPFRPSSLSAGLGVLELLDNTVSARRAPEAAMETLQHVAQSARMLKGRRGEAAEAARCMLSTYAAW